MPSELQQNRYDQLIRRVGGIVGPGSKVSEALTELFPTLDVENVPAELLWLMGTRICQGGGRITAVAGQAGRMQLFNPVGSGKLVILTDVHFASALTTTAMWAITPTIFGVPTSTEVFRDTRELPPTAPTAQMHAQTSIALSGGTSQTRVLGSTDLHIHDENSIAVLAPGTGFQIGSGTFNSDVWIGMMWRERPAEQSELNF